jgi:plastocyanin
MKKNIIIALVVLGILIMVGGIYFFVSQYPAPNNNNNNQPPANNPPASGNTGTGTPSASTHNITISGFAFSPSTLTIKVGDGVVWTNGDSVSHTITSDTGTELASPTFGRGQTYSHTFSTAGTYAYHCSIHSTMKGTIVVQ